MKIGKVNDFTTVSGSFGFVAQTGMFAVQVKKNPRTLPDKESAGIVN